MCHKEASRPAFPWPKLGLTPPVVDDGTQKTNVHPLLRNCVIVALVCFFSVFHTDLLFLHSFVLQSFFAPT